MSVRVGIETNVTENGHVFHTVTVSYDGVNLVTGRESILPGGKDPGIAEVATQALESLEQRAREARKKLTAMGLLVQRSPSNGPYR